MDKTTEILNRMFKLNFQGNVIPFSWYKEITTKDGKPDLIAITILSEIVYWYRPEVIRDEATGQVIGLRKKFAEDKLQKSYGQLAEEFGFSKKQVREAVKRLSEQRLISCELRTITVKDGLKLVNVMYIEPIVENIERITFKTYEIAAASTDNELRPGTNNGLRPSTDNGFNVVPITAQDEGYILAGRGVLPCRDIPTTGEGDTNTEITTEITTESIYKNMRTQHEQGEEQNLEPEVPKPKMVTLSSVQLDRFNEFWQVYPKKKAKVDCMKAWRQINPDAKLFEDIMAGLRRAMNSKEWKEQDGKFIPYPATFLRQGRWMDEYEEEVDRWAAWEQRSKREFENILKGGREGEH